MVRESSFLIFVSPIALTTPANLSVRPAVPIPQIMETDWTDASPLLSPQPAATPSSMTSARMNAAFFIFSISPLLFLCGTPQYLTYFYDGASRKNVPQNKGVSAEKTSLLSYHAPFPQM